MEFICIDNYELVIKYIAKYSLDKNVYKELGEPIFHNSNTKYCICLIDNISVGFISYEILDNICILKYCYIENIYRNKGIFKILHNTFIKNLPKNVFKIKVISSNYALPIYIKYGYIIIKEYKICSHLILTL
jgi:hypothetical protein